MAHSGLWAPTWSVLFMTNSEVGQANVTLASALEVARNHSAQVHIAAFAELQPRIEAINAEAKFLAAPITFHELDGPSIQESMFRFVNSVADCTHPPGFFGAIRSYYMAATSLLSWRPDEYIATYRSCVQVIEKVQPAALVIENALGYARDAAKKLHVEYIVLAPCGAKEVIGSKLPGAPMMLKWPMISSGYQYPLSPFDRIKNVALGLAFVLILLHSSTIRAVDKARKEAKIDGPNPFLNAYAEEGIQYILPFLSATDYANFEEYDLPSNILACGPITLPPLQPMQESDAELLRWLQRRPTIMVNLGSLFEPDLSSALEMSKGLKQVLDARSDVQILWKLKLDWTSSPEISAVIDSFAVSKRLRVESWLKTSPSVLISTGHIVCSVHHGGANSYYEACRAGVPQLVLPVWIDTYEFAERARHRGIGLIGNVGVAPGVESTQLATKLLRIIGDETIKLRSTGVAAACRRRGEGREIAAQAIVQWAQDNRSLSKKSQ